MERRYRDTEVMPEELPAEPEPARRSEDAVLALQRSIGNHGTARVLARDADKNRPNFPNSVKIGKLGPIEITGGNIDEWAAKKTPDDLHVISPHGKHSEELKRLFDSKAQIETMETSSVVGENTIVTIVFEKCRIRRFSSDDEHDDWLVEYGGAKRQTLAIGTPRR
jgi:hypothetical protein